MTTIRHYRELVCWQLSVELRRGLIAVTDRPGVRTNFKFCQQVGDSSRSAPANIAEGFKRSNRVFMQFLDIALGSLRETENHIDEALERHYIDALEHEQLRTIAKRAIRAAEELRAYLRKHSPQARERRTPTIQPNRPDGTRLTTTNPPKPDKPQPT